MLFGTVETGRQSRELRPTAHERVLSMRPKYLAGKSREPVDAEQIYFARWTVKLSDHGSRRAILASCLRRQIAAALGVTGPPDHPPGPRDVVVTAIHDIA
jgi:hypothetical protein